MIRIDWYEKNGLKTKDFDDKEEAKSTARATSLQSTTLTSTVWIVEHHGVTNAQVRGRYVSGVWKPVKDASAPIQQPTTPRLQPQSRTVHVN